MDNLAPKEIADEEMINQAFHELLNDYLNTKHRKKVGNHYEGFQLCQSGA